MNNPEKKFMFATIIQPESGESYGIIASSMAVLEKAFRRATHASIFFDRHKCHRVAVIQLGKAGELEVSK